MKNKYLSFIIIFAATIVVIVVLWNTLSAFVKIDKTEIEYEKKLDSLIAENEILISTICVAMQENKSLSTQIDSIEKKKNLIKVIYVNKQKDIDNASVDSIVSEFELLFSNSDIR